MKALETIWAFEVRRSHTTDTHTDTVITDGWNVSPHLIVTSSTVVTRGTAFAQLRVQSYNWVVALKSGPSVAYIKAWNRDNIHNTRESIGENYVENNPYQDIVDILRVIATFAPQTCVFYRESPFLRLDDMDLAPWDIQQLFSKYKFTIP